MEKVQFTDPIVLAYNLRLDLGKGETLSNGNRVSDYHILAQVGTQEDMTATVSLIENTHYVSKPYYSVHLVDDITGADCELFYTDDLELESLVNLLREIGEGMPRVVGGIEPAPLGDADKVRRLEAMIAGECIEGEEHFGASLSYWRDSAEPIRIGKGGLKALRDYYLKNREE